MRRWALLWVVAAWLLAGCGDDDPLGNINPSVRDGRSRIFEIAADDLPSAFDLVSGRRLFTGVDIDPTTGDIFLDGGTGLADLRLRSVSSLLRAEASHAAELRDLGAIDFDALVEAPDDDYVDAEDSTGVGIVAGHVYALRVTRSDLGPNFAKLIVDAVGPGTAPGRRFIDFRYAIQTEPGNRRFDEGADADPN